MKKKLLVLLLALAAVFALFAVSASAAEITASGDVTDTMTWELDVDGVLTIRGTGAIPDYTASNGHPWDSVRASITAVVVEDGVTGIGVNAFSDCENLTSVELPASVTSIGMAAFSGCSSLTSVTIPDAVTYLDNSVFSGCSSLTSVTIPNCVISIGMNAFSGCSSLTSVNIPDSVTIIEERAFSGCGGLTSVVIPAGVTSIGNYTFSNCNSLTSVELPDSVTSIGQYAFFGCTALESVLLPSSVKTIESRTFSGCIGLKEIAIPYSVTSIAADAFSGCDALTDVYYSDTEPQWQKITIAPGNTALTDAELHIVPDVLTYDIEDDGVVITGCDKNFSGLMVVPAKLEGLPIVAIGESAFDNCENIRAVRLPATVTEIRDSAFHDCTAMTSINLPDGVTKIGNGAFEYCGNLSSISIPDGATEIGDAAFESCGNLSSISIPDGVTKIGSGVFAWCRNIKSISIPDSVTTIGSNAFAGCGLTSLTIPDGVTCLEWCAFAYCEELQSVSIPDSVTSIGSDAFNSCSSLTSIIIPDSVSEMGVGVFYRCSSLQTVILPNGISSVGGGMFNDCTALQSVSIPDSVTVIEYNAFQNCTSLTELEIPDSVTSIGNSAFSGCTALTKFVHPQQTVYGFGVFQDCRALTTANLASADAIPENSFRGCSALETVTIGAGAKSIDRYAFYGCGALQTVTLPNTLSAIEIGAFRGCDAITDVYFNGTEAQWQALTIGSNNAALTNAAIHCIDLADVLTHEVVGDHVVITGCNIAISGVLEIPAELNGLPVTAIGDGAFSDFDHLLRVTIPESVTTIGNSTFSGCTGLTSVTISEGVTTIRENAFCDCAALQDVDYGGTNLQWRAISVAAGNDPLTEAAIHYPGDPTDLSYEIADDHVVITGCDDNVTSVEIPAEIAGLPVTEIKDRAFRSHGNLTSVTIPDSVTSIGDRAFSSCGGLTSVIIPDSVTSIGFAVFSGCSSLTSVTIPDGVTSISDSTFYGCGGLMSVTLPKTLTRVGFYAFEGCTALTDVHYGANAKKWKAVEVYSGNEPLTNAEFHYEGNAPAEILTDPADVRDLVGRTAVFTVEATGDIASYQWQYSDDGGNTWVNSASTTATATCKITAARDGRMYRCIVTDVDDEFEVSGAAVLTVAEPVRIISSPANSSGAAGRLAAFIVEAEGDDLAYRWEYSYDGGSTWYPSGAYTNYTFCPINEGSEHRLYRCVVSDRYGCSATSESAAVLLERALAITAQPKSATVQSGNYATFTVSAEGANLTYQWQYCKPGGAWTDCSAATKGYNTDTLTVQGVTGKTNRNGYQYRCVVSSGTASVTSAAATLTVKAAAITSQPQSAETVAADYATFSVTATGSGLTYQWQFKTPNGAWKDCSSATKGYNTATLRVQGVTGKTNRNGYQYRCVVTDATGVQLTSNAATLTVSAMTITAQPKNAGVAAADYAVFTVAADGANLTYQWQFKTPNGAWKDCSSATKGYNTATLRVQGVTGKTNRSGYQYRCIVKDAAGRSVTSDAATLTVTSLNITAQPQNAEVAANDYAKFTVKAAGKGLTYQWQYLKPNGVWTDCSSATKGYNTDTLTVQGATGKVNRNNYQYRCVVRDASGDEVTTVAAKLTVK